MKINIDKIKYSRSIYLYSYNMSNNYPSKRQFISEEKEKEREKEGESAIKYFSYYYIAPNRSAYLLACIRQQCVLCKNLLYFT